MFPLLPNIFLVRLLFIVLFFSSCGGGREKKLTKMLDREIRNQCACFESEKISISPRVKSIINEKLDEYLEENSFGKAIINLTASEKEELLRLGRAVFDTSAALHKCLAKAEENIVIYNSEDGMWGRVVSKALGNRNTCDFYKAYTGSLKYASFAIEYSNLTDSVCNCFSHANIALDTTNQDIIHVLDDAAGFLEPYVEQESFDSLSKDEKAQLQKFSEQIKDTTARLGQCLNQLKEKFRRLDLQYYVPSSGPEKYSGIKWALREKLPECRLMYYYFYTISQPTLEELRSKN